MRYYFQVHQECDIEVWSKPGQKTQEVTKTECEPAQGQVSGDAVQDKKTVSKRVCLIVFHWSICTDKSL